MKKIEESILKKTKLIGSEAGSIENRICRLIDIIFDDKKETELKIDLNFFDIKGTILLYGVTGIGKTTLVYNCLNYALDRYGVESYKLESHDVIVPEMGLTVKNIYRELEEFKGIKEGILFLDEIDRFCVNRANTNEISELKRLLLEVMSFLDSMNSDSKKMLIGCTNVIGQIDDALKRRFSILEELKLPTIQEKIEFARICLEKVGLPSCEMGECNVEWGKYQTFDQIKKKFRDAILSNNFERFGNNFVKGGLH